MAGHWQASGQAQHPCAGAASPPGMMTGAGGREVVGGAGGAAGGDCACDSEVAVRTPKRVTVSKRFNSHSCCHPGGVIEVWARARSCARLCASEVGGSSGHVVNIDA